MIKFHTQQKCPYLNCKFFVPIFYFESWLLVNLSDMPLGGPKKEGRKFSLMIWDYQKKKMKSQKLEINFEETAVIFFVRSNTHTNYFKFQRAQVFSSQIFQQYQRKWIGVKQCVGRYSCWFLASLKLQAPAKVCLGGLLLIG